MWLNHAAHVLASQVRWPLAHSIGNREVGIATLMQAKFDTPIGCAMRVF
jgi:kynureninase